MLPAAVTADRLATRSVLCPGVMVSPAVQSPSLREFPGVGSSSVSVCQVISDKKSCLEMCQKSAGKGHQQLFWSWYLPRESCWRGWRQGVIRGIMARKRHKRLQFVILRTGRKESDRLVMTEFRKADCSSARGAAAAGSSGRRGRGRRNRSSTAWSCRRLLQASGSCCRGKMGTAEGMGE